MGKPIDCNGSAFAGLKNPYTGERMHVKMLVREGAEPLFFAPGEYDTCNREPSARAAYDNWSRIDGVAGLRAGQAITCAYTGETLTPAKDGEQHWFVGGFNPSHLYPRDEFLYYATMRNGVATLPKPGKVARVTRPEEHAPAPKGHEVECTDAAMEAAVELAKKHGDKLAKKGRR